MTYFPAAGATYTLNASISSTATSFTLTSFTEPVSGTPYTMVLLNTDIIYFTIQPRTSSSEFVSATGITQNADGTALITGVTRGLAKKYPFTASATFRLPHSGQSQVIMSDAPQVFNEYLVNENTETITGAKTFSITPINTGGLPVNPTDLATKQYVDNTATGTTTVNRVVISGIAGETIAVDQLIYLKASDGRWWLCDADTAATVDNVVLGIAQGAGTAGNAITSGVLISGFNTFSSLTLTANTKYYASNTAGGFSSTPGTTEVTLGESQTTTTFVFAPRYDQQLTEDQQDALVGTSGTPSSTNRYVTNDDTATAATASKIARRLASGDITVPTTPTNATDAASKAYADTINASLAYTVNAVETVNTFFTCVYPMVVTSSSAITGWTMATPSITASGPNWITIQSSGGTSFAMSAPLPGNAATDSYSPTLGKDIRIKFRLRFGDTSDRKGFGMCVTPANIYTAQTDVTNGEIRFILNGATMYAQNANGATATTTDVSSGVTFTNWNTYEIVFDPGNSAKFYINGALVATHTTNLPTSGTLVLALGNDTNARFFYLFSPIVSIET